MRTIAEHTWLLTVDQDSHWSTTHTCRARCCRRSEDRSLRRATRCASGRGSHGRCEPATDDVTPLIDDRGMPRTEEVIQTGTLWNVDGADADRRLRRDAGDGRGGCRRLPALRERGYHDRGGDRTCALTTRSATAAWSRRRSSGDGHRALARATRIDAAQSTAAVPGRVRRITAACAAHGAPRGWSTRRWA